MISTKGRYAIRILLDLAEHSNGSYIPMKEVAARQEISLSLYKLHQLRPSLYYYKGRAVRQGEDLNGRVPDVPGLRAGVPRYK